MSRIEVDSPPGAAHAGGSSTRRHFPPVRVWVLALMAGLIAGFASWLIGEPIHRRFDPSAVAMSGHPSAQMMSSLFRARRAAETSGATLSFASLGAVLGLALGLAGGSASGSVRAAMRAAIVGSILGGAVGAALTKVILPFYFRTLDPDTNDLIMGIMTHVVISSGIGAMGGAAFGVGLGDRSRAVRAVLGGLLGAAAGALVHQMVGAHAFPLDATSSPISTTWGSRLFARLAVTTLASAGVAMGALDQAKGGIPSPASQEHES